jgi:hypothetical protein
MMLFATCSRTFLRKGEPKTASFCLAGVFRQLGLGVKALEVAHPPAHQKPDHARGARREMRFPIGKRPVINRAGAGHSVSVEHRPECQADESHTGVRQEMSASVAGAEAMREMFIHGGRSVQRIEMKSL